MLPVLESEHTHLLFGCYLFVTNANTHTCVHTHTVQPLVPFPVLTTIHTSHTRFFLLRHTLPFLFCQFLGSAAVICCCHLTLSAQIYTAFCICRARTFTFSLLLSIFAFLFHHLDRARRRIFFKLQRIGTLLI